MGAAACADRLPQPDGEPATLVLRNGKIATVEASRPEAQAIAFRGDTIAAVGSNQEIQPYIGANTEVVDLQHPDEPPGHQSAIVIAVLVLRQLPEMRSALSSFLFGRGAQQARASLAQSSLVPSVVDVTTKQNAHAEPPISLAGAHDISPFLSAGNRVARVRPSRPYLPGPFPEQSRPVRSQVNT